MTKQSVIDTIEESRQEPPSAVNNHIIYTRILNYIEANIDDFVECYEGTNEIMDIDYS